MMKTTTLLSLCAVAGASILSAPALAGPHEDKILEFDTMVGVAAPYIGPANAIRGVPGGGLPWVVARAEGELRVSGRLEIRVEGLVFANDPSVPPDRRGINTVANFRAIVSCMSRNDVGEPTVVNTSTDNFPASRSGDARIEATVLLPEPCIAPIVFVTSPGGAWFAATGM